MRLLTTATLLTFLAVPVISASDWATSSHLQHWCATGDEIEARLEYVRKWSALREGPRQRDKAATPSTVRFSEGVFHVTRDDSMAPFDTPFDLPERTMLRFRRVDDRTLNVEKSEFTYEETLGKAVRQFAPGATDWHFHTQALKFEFPFYDGRHTTLFPSAMKALHFSAPALSTLAQTGPLEALTERLPMIAPLLQTQASSGVHSILWINDSASDRIVLTWKSQFHSAFEYDLQVVLHSSGDFTFAYRRMKEMNWGSIVVTSGKEAWRSRTTPIASVQDEENLQVSPLLDIRRVDVNRVANSDLLEVRVQMRAPIDQRSALAAGHQIAVEIGGLQQMQFILYPTRTYYAAGVWPGASDHAAASIEGDTIVLRVLEEQLALPGPSFNLRVTSRFSPSILSDEVTAAVTLAPAATAEFDLNTLSSTSTDGPIVESFTLPILVPAAVWGAIKDRFGYTDEDFDSVGVFQTFLTDIVTFASAYSTVGNPGVDGVSSRSNYGVSKPKIPGLLHMNRIDYSFNNAKESAMHVLGHEFGHRWLYFFRFQDGATRSTKLNPLGGHPAQYVHTPAAFRVYTDSDSSTMGGAAFQEVAGAFISPSVRGYYGYSWHDLYLMGLASTDEVAPWYYIDNSSPELGGAYYPPTGQTFLGVRKNVSIQQVVQAMGPRAPAYPDAPKNFRLAIVLLERAEAPATEAQTRAMRAMRDDFASYFPIATGGRATVQTTSLIPDLAAAFDVLPGVITTGMNIAFADRSKGGPLTWLWDFGDGRTSNERNPSILFTKNGLFDVRLTIFDGTKSSTSTKRIAVTASNNKPRKRP